MDQSSLAGATTFTLLLLRNLISLILTSGEKSLLSLNLKPLLLLREFISALCLFILRLITFLPSQLLSSSRRHHHHHSVNPQKAADAYAATNTRLEAGGAAGDSAIARALSQLVSIINDIPVSSRKYEVVRSLAERIIDENLREGSEALREVNCCVLSAAFSRTLSQLEAAAAEQDGPSFGGFGGGGGLGLASAGWVCRSVLYLGDLARSKVERSTEEGVNDAEGRRKGKSAEKMAAELLWLGQKLAESGGIEGAVEKWASATNLAWLALSAEPRLQGFLVKASAFLIKQAKDIGEEEGLEESHRERKTQMKMKMLLSWLPLLCRANNGTDAPILSSREREEVERVLEEMIEMLDQQGDREKVLSLWLHHFADCPSSDWPNLFSCYARWCTASRRLILTE
ncbi:hypothetical protein Dimus_004487 [Dionaea muscipula]